MATPSLPLVDISPLFGDDPADRMAVAHALDRACVEAGFLYIRATQFDAALFHRLMVRATLYFAQGREAKMARYIGLSENHSGYVPVGEERFGGEAAGEPDLKEAYDVNCDYRRADGRRPLLGPNLWPDMPGFREDVLAYYRHVTAIGRRLFGAFALALGREETHFDTHLTHPPSQLRLIHYPFDPTVRDRPGIGAHTDYECFTLLFATAPGLEVQARDGTWMAVPRVPGTMILNIGDMMEIMSNGRYTATTHRVRRIAAERYAFPLFFSCDYDHVVAPLVPGEAPRYAPLKGGEHLLARTTESFAYLRRRSAAA